MDIIYLKIGSDKFYETASRYGLDNFNTVLNDNKIYAMFQLSEGTTDKKTMLYIKNIMEYIFNTETVEPDQEYLYCENYEEKEIDVYTIFLSLIDYMRNKYGERHYKERLAILHNKNCVETTDVIPKLHWFEDGTFMMTPAYCNGAFGDIFYSDHEIRNITIKTSKARKNKRAVYRNFNWDNLYDSCELFNDFVNGEPLSHNELIHIARNICGADKGKNMFLEIVNSQYGYTEKNWREILNSIIKGDIPIKSCDSCPYSDECCHCANMLETAKPSNHEVKITKIQEYADIREAELDLYYKFNKALRSNEKGIHIIKAQTGLGKTDAYIKYMKTAEKPCVIAVPTHELKEEIFKRTIENGVENICQTPAFPESEISKEISVMVNHYYQIGAGKEVMHILGVLLEKLEKSGNDYKIIKKFLDESNSSIKYKGHIITTHAKLLTMSEIELSEHQVIIDEDIMRQLYNTSVVPMNDIRNILFKKKNIKHEIKNRLKTFTHDMGYKTWKNNEKIDVSNDFPDIDSNIYGLLNSDTTYTNSDGVLFVDKKKLDYSKVIIMSATIEPELYRSFLKDKKVFSYECRKAKYKGKVIQYTDSSYSRHDFYKNKEKLKKLINITAGNPVITFQSIQEHFKTKYHFGNVEGLNTLEGKDLFVVGLPNLPEEVYKLYGMCADADISGRMRPQRIDHNGKSFKLNTFDNDILRMIQMWLLSSQLEQSIGRARLLRNDCTVTVFSGFPVEQAEYYSKYPKI